METSADHALSAFVSARPRLFGIAYRMLGSAVEAEDIVQDVWLRWQSTDRSAIPDATAFLVTTTTRLAINVVQSARSRRETYVGPWLPDPVDTSTDPHLGAERGEALGFAGLLLMEKLSPTERAAYLLDRRDAARIEANGQPCVLVSRDGTVGALVTMHASAEGIDQLMWMIRPSKLAAISRAPPGTREPYSSDPAGGSSIGPPPRGRRLAERAPVEALSRNGRVPGHRLVHATDHHRGCSDDNERGNHEDRGHWREWTHRNEAREEAPRRRP